MGHAARIREMRKYKILVAKLEGNRPRRGPRRTWEDNIRMDRKETGWEGLDWMHVVQDRDWWRALFNTLMNLQVR
jgi:hypothetical protein